LSKWIVRTTTEIQSGNRPGLADDIEDALAEDGAIDPVCSIDAASILTASFTIEAAGFLDATGAGRSFLKQALETVPGMVVDPGTYSQCPLVPSDTRGALLSRINPRTPESTIEDDNQEAV
jgi:hypothetical protein